MILDQEKHSRLLADLPHIAQHAGVLPNYIKESMIDYCTDGEIDWVTNFNQYREKGVLGLVLEGVSNADIHCQAIAGALIRNYIDARLIPLNQLLDLQRVNECPSPTVLLIPNLFGTVIGKGMPEWRAQGIYDILLQRSIHNKVTVVAVQSMVEMKKVMGESLDQLLQCYKRVKG